MVKSYCELLVWQRATELMEVVYEATARLQASESYGLTSQRQRAAVSVPSNIAEGHERESTREYLRSLKTSRGSHARFETKLLLCERLKFLSADDIAQSMSTSDELGKILRGRQRSLNEKLN